MGELGSAGVAIACSLWIDRVREEELSYPGEDGSTLQVLSLVLHHPVPSLAQWASQDMFFS